MKNEYKNMMTELSNEDLSMVSGGNDADIKVEIKTLPGDNDDYKIALSDTIDDVKVETTVLTLLKAPSQHHIPMGLHLYS